jgi:uncharacterized tellurite resistance protein B-like protein
MPSLLFPTGATARSADRGTFSCPSCRALQPYTRVVVGRVLRLFALRVPAGRYGEYIECATCLATYRPSALAFRERSGPQDLPAEYERALLRVLALLVISDGRIHPAEIATVQRIYSAVTGSQLSHETVLAEANEVGAHPTTVPRYLSRVLGVLNEHGKEQVLRGAAMVTGADGRVHDAEVEVVRRLGAVLQVDADRVEYILRTFA